MKHIYLLCLLSILSFRSHSVPAHTSTWTDGIACIVYSHCTGCHNPTGIAPFSLTTYNDVYQNRLSILASVQARQMPPYPADPGYRKFAHSNTLEQHEIDDIVDWVNNFAPLGDANNIPAAPTYSSGYQIQNPDFVAQIPTYTISSNTDVYRLFVLPVNNSVQNTIESIEVYPGNRQIVHHALVFQDTSDVPMNLDLADPLPGYSAFGGTGSGSSKLLSVYTPGQGAFTFAPGFGSKMLENSYIVVQMHYPGGVMGEVDSTQIRIKYATTTLRNVSTIPVINHNFSLTNGPLVIPADSVKTFYGQSNVNTNRTLTGLMPHMHLIGTAVKAWFVSPANDTVPLIDIPNWDFHWQYFYQFQKPILIPAGSIVYAQATYDNTLNNPHNPSNPPQDVSSGESTLDEMFIIYMNVSTYQSGDTSVIIDTASHIAHHESCFNVAGLKSIAEEQTITIYPNPAKDRFFINGNYKACMITLYDQRGKVVYTKQAKEKESIWIEGLANGLYYLQVNEEEGSNYYRKLVKQE